MIADRDRPNNVDVEYGLLLGEKPVDIAVLTERNRQALRVYRINSESGELQEAGDMTVSTASIHGLTFRALLDCAGLRPPLQVFRTSC